MSIAKDYGDVVKILVSDTTLKNLMLIPSLEQTNYGLLIDKYFMQSYQSDKFTNEGVCRMLIRDKMQIDTYNDYVKWTGLVFELYVPLAKDMTDGFQTRTNKICDRLIELFNRTYVNSNKYYYKNSYELFSSSLYYKRTNISFDYKKIYL